MDEYISREKAINAIKSLESSMSAKDNYAKGYDAALGRALIAVREAPPAADVQPVRRGRWLEHHAIWIDQQEIEGWFVQAKCSECEKWAHVMNPYTKSVGYENCPNCGARMDGCADDENS